MALKFQNDAKTLHGGVLVCVLLVVSLVLSTIYGKEGQDGVLHTVQNAAASLVSPFAFVGAAVGDAGNTLGTTLEDATASEQTISSLQEQIAELTELVSQTEEYRLEVERLEALLELKDSSDVEGIAARVVGRGTDAWNQTLTIDVGENDGITTGLTVMGSYGVVGQVVSVAPGFSTVRLLTDPSSGAAALVQSSRAEGVVRGSLDGLLYLENIDTDVQVSVGDVVLTSGLGGSYTRGLLIGTVVKVEGSQGDASRRIVVSQNDTATPLEEVFVVASATADDTAMGAVATAGVADAADNDGGDDADSGASDAADSDGSGDAVGNDVADTASSTANTTDTSGRTDVAGDAQ